jgi:hypothetical protein
MRSRTTAAVIAAITCLVLIPGAAEARGTHSHGKQHKRHAHKVRVKVLRTSNSRQYTDPTTPTTPAAGLVTVLSFTGGKLTLQHGDGTTAGRVTSSTSISCQSASPVPVTSTAPTTATAKSRSHDEGGDNGDDNGSQQNTTSAPSTTPTIPGASTTQGDDENDNESGENESGDDDAPNGSAQSSSSCGQSALTAGAIIRRAKLTIDNGVATFDQIELLRP